MGICQILRAIGLQVFSGSRKITDSDQTHARKGCRLLPKQPEAEGFKIIRLAIPGGTHGNHFIKKINDFMVASRRCTKGLRTFFW
jgi:hypothetical protein